MKAVPVQPSALARTIAAKISVGSDPYPFLVAGETIYFAAHRRTHPHEPMSATVKLIQGIYATQPEMARRIVRNRIFSSDPPTEMCLAMVRVAAKNFTFLDGQEKQNAVSPLDSFQWIEIQAPSVLPLRSLSPATVGVSDHAWMSVAKKLAELSGPPQDSDRPLFQRDRKIAAILVSRDNKLLGHAINTNSSNRTLHAEVNLIQNFYSQMKTALPDDSRIYSTMKPCKMCAGMIWHASESSLSGKGIQVVFDQLDSGPNGRSTVLDSGSFERKRACPDSPQQERVVQLQLN